MFATVAASHLPPRRRDPTTVQGGGDLSERPRPSGLSLGDERRTQPAKPIPPQATQPNDRPRGNFNRKLVCGGPAGVRGRLEPPHSVSACHSSEKDLGCGGPMRRSAAVPQRPPQPLDNAGVRRFAAVAAAAKSADISSPPASIGLTKANPPLENLGVLAVCPIKT